MIFKHEFWITNISRERDISLRDLGLTIRKGESRNLLDSKHYNYSLDQLEKSASSGSIFAKSTYIKVRNVPPREAVSPGRYISKNGRFVKEQPRMSVKIVEPKFEELDFDSKMNTEKFAAEEANIAADDHAPALAVDKRYVNNKPPEKSALNIEEEEYNE
jgi:hypothetical protein